MLLRFDLISTAKNTVQPHNRWKCVPHSLLPNWVKLTGSSLYSVGAEVRMQLVSGFHNPLYVWIVCFSSLRVLRGKTLSFFSFPCFHPIITNGETIKYFGLNVENSSRCFFFLLCALIWSSSRRCWRCSADSETRGAVELCTAAHRSPDAPRPPRS